MYGGISIYIGLDNTKEENEDLLRRAKKYGLKRVFTSFHIPETDKGVFSLEVADVLHLARELELDVISDISPNALAILDGVLEKGEVLAKEECSDKEGRTCSAQDMEIGLLLANLKELGIGTVRLDYGFTAKEIAEMSHDGSGIKIQFNASAITEEFLDELESVGTDLEKIDALHNFYPRENTGLSEEFFLEKTRMLQKRGIKTAAFVPSFNRPRSPIRAGLPTLEAHRECSFDYGVRHLIALGIDEIFISDSLPSEEEIKLLANMKAGQVNLRPDYLIKDENILSLLQREYHTRPDEARDAFRAEESRGYCKGSGLQIIPENTVKRVKGCITLDNEDYQRYMGELQILKCDLEADKRVNVVAQLSAEEMNLLDYLKPGKAFQLL